MAICIYAKILQILQKDATVKFWVALDLWGSEEYFYSQEYSEKKSKNKNKYMYFNEIVIFFINIFFLHYKH